MVPLLPLSLLLFIVAWAEQQPPGLKRAEDARGRWWSLNRWHRPAGKTPAADGQRGLHDEVTQVRRLKVQRLVLLALVTSLCITFARRHDVVVVAGPPELIDAPAGLARSTGYAQLAFDNGYSYEAGALIVTAPQVGTPCTTEGAIFLGWKDDGADLYCLRHSGALHWHSSRWTGDPQ